MRIVPLTYPVPSDLPVPYTAMLIFGPIVIGLGIYFYFTRHRRLWKKGIYPPKLKFSQDNLLEAYLSLSALMMRSEKEKRGIQVQFINRYFNRYFPMANYNFGDSLVFSMRHPIQIDSVCSWLKREIPKDSERAQVLFFLAGIASLNGKINVREQLFIDRIRAELSISKGVLEHIYSVYESFNAHFEEQKTQRPMRKVKRVELYRNILEVPANADRKTLKQAYRRLAKLYHPDTMVDATEAQKKMAEDKFNEIQNAYDFLQNELKESAAVD
ncbi:MAG: J domain-containing protein [Flavobacteriales bacterium]|nr:J domain-containing protein [Flavobacteriales bacterium]